MYIALLVPMVLYLGFLASLISRGDYAGATCVLLMGGVPVVGWVTGQYFLKRNIKYRYLACINLLAIVLAAGVYLYVSEFNGESIVVLFLIPVMSFMGWFWGTVSAANEKSQ